MKKTVVIGASENPERYAYKAAIALQKQNHEVIPIGLTNGEINGIKIINEKINILTTIITSIIVEFGCFFILFGRAWWSKWIFGHYGNYGRSSCNDEIIGIGHEFGCFFIFVYWLL